MVLECVAYLSVVSPVNDFEETPPIDKQVTSV